MTPPRLSAAAGCCMLLQEHANSARIFITLSSWQACSSVAQFMPIYSPVAAAAVIIEHSRVQSCLYFPAFFFLHMFLLTQPAS
jgi:hypothetical protein